MKRKRLLLALPVTLLAVGAVVGCSSGESGGGTPSTYFTYEDISFEDTIGEKRNSEVHQYGALKVNPVEEELREDFAFGVDASMTREIEKLGGVYYNSKGEEQDVYQIYREAGVNFMRFRIWVDPKTAIGQEFGGGNNNFTTTLAMAKRAKAANLNVMIDFHYSDFWADPDAQQLPQSWMQDEVISKMESYTRTTLQNLKDGGVTVDAVQIGNETNNGLAGFKINWNKADSSFDTMASYFRQGIAGAKSVFPNVRTIIHLANGGNSEEFKKYFTELDKRGVNYDIIGASYYPHLSGSLDDLQHNLNQISEITNKPVMVVETSWGFTEEYIEGVTDNQYDAKDENVGGYLTGEQGQATAIRDICNVLSKVPNKKGLGIFYWEPGWLPVVKDGTVASWATKYGQSYKQFGNTKYSENYKDGLASWCNQGLFSYTGKALSSLYTYRYIRGGMNKQEEKSVSARDTNLSVTLNLAAQETLPTQAKVVTNFDALRYRSVTWDAASIEEAKIKGDHTGLTGTLDGKYPITCSAHCIENFIVDPGFENQGTTDDVKSPWNIDYATPINDKVVKLDRKKDIRSGKTDLNWYHSGLEFTFQVSQSVTLEAGTYSLTTYVMCVELRVAKHTRLELFVDVNGTETILDMCSDTYIKGWSFGYQAGNISNIVLSEKTTIKVGLRGAAEKAAWGHNDDWELVKVED